MIKNITLSAEETLIRKARLRAKKENTSLNKLFREWLERYVSQEHSSLNYEKLMNKLLYATPGKKFTRNEINERKET